jgi:WD40 repeat protein
MKPAQAFLWALTLVQVWTANGQDQARVRLQVQSGRAQFTSMAFSSDGRSVVTTGRDGAARLWDVATGREIRRFETADMNGPRVG